MLPSFAPARPTTAAAVDTAAAKWDVADPPTDGSHGGWGWQDASLDVDTGTWMSVDVAPDGGTVVFDLLGDIYTMPIGGSSDGSQVRCIAEGLQWDMQPRFSPDGQWIAFVSDRTGEGGKGGDNIWIMKPDGTWPPADHQGVVPPGHAARLDCPIRSSSSRASTSPPGAAWARARCGCTTSAARPTACS